MKIGTKSILFGAHCFFIHPWFVALAWWQLYGFPLDPRLWCAFFLHDIGYWGKPNMDGDEGETHPELGARIMHALFDRRGQHYWLHFTLFHSRFYAKKWCAPHSPLCAADKLATALTPRWIYLPMVKLTGEIHEYMGMAGVGKYSSDKVSEMRKLRAAGGLNPHNWHFHMTNHMRRWAFENR